MPITSDFAYQYSPGTELYYGLRFSGTTLYAGLYHTSGTTSIQPYQYYGWLLCIM